MNTLILKAIISSTQGVIGSVRVQKNQRTIEVCNARTINGDAVNVRELKLSASKKSMAHRAAMQDIYVVGNDGIVLID